MSADMARGVRALDGAIIVEIHEQAIKLRLLVCLQVDLCSEVVVPRFELHSKDSPHYLGKTCAEHRLFVREN